MKLGHFDFYLEGHDTPLKQLFRITKSGRGDVTVEFGYWALHVSDLRQVEQHFRTKGGPDNEEREPFKIREGETGAAS